MKTRDRLMQKDFRGKAQDKRGAKQEVLRGAKRQVNTTSNNEVKSINRERTKRSGVEAVKLHLKVTGDPGRTSRSATAVRKTSVRMTAIKEYPFDLSDLKNQPSIDEKPPAKPPQQTLSPANNARPSLNVIEGKRKVSIMANESSKDRENMPSERERMSHSSLSCHHDNYLPSDSSLETDALNRHWNVSVSAKAEGPSRRKSNLHNAMASDIDSSWDRQGHIEGRFKKYSTTSSVYSKKALSQHSEYIESSWWYACCAKCHTEDSGIPSWEPPNWQKVCPYPLCPSYRRFAQTLSVLIIGILVWVIIWIVMGDTAAPGGQLFTLAALTIIAYFGGTIMMKITTLPALIGMLVIGILMKNTGFVNFDETYLHVSSYIRKIALTIILTRAGLDLDPVAMKKYFLTVIKLALVPWTFECVLCAVLAYFFLGLPWDWAFLLSSIIAAVSPAVIVPCLFRLREKGYGVSKGIPTLVLAVSGVDDAASVAVFGIVSSIMFASSSLTMNVIQGPLSILGGIALGVVCGYLVKFVPERNDAFLVPLRVFMLLAGGLMMVLGSEEIGWGGAGPLAVIAFAFIASKNWCELGWELDDNPVATAFEIFWMFFEPMLFGITGAQVVIAELEPRLVLIGGGILVVCAILRAIVTSACAVRSNLNMREKIFVGLAWMAKATVQAALGPVALDEVRKMAGIEPDPVLIQYAETVVTVCIMSIVITAPIGAIVITLTGPKLLTRTTKPPVLEGWRRSHRPSIRDISIIDEEELAERDAEAESYEPATTPTTPAPITVQPHS